MLPTTGYVNYIYILGACLLVLILARLIYVVLKKRKQERNRED
ncbi:MAG: LPXTG cell wall anchor domain-containing protein [Bacilli bacterium]